MEKCDSEPAKRGASTSKKNEVLELEENELELKDLELEEIDTTLSEEITGNEKSHSDTNSSKHISDINKGKESTRSKSKENIQKETVKFADQNESNLVLKANKRASSELEKQPNPNSSVIVEEEQIEIDDTELEDRIGEGTLELEEQNKDAAGDEVCENKDEETAVPLLVGESVSINMQGKRTSVLVHTGDNKGVKSNKNESLFSNPIPRLRNSWAKSTNVCDFLSRVLLIVFSTLGWILCSGGLPFVSIAMFIIGSVYIDDCKVQPNIPLYLIVGGVFGTLQHFISFWNKCFPESRKGRLSNYRAYYNAIDGAMTLFLLIWFIVGCAWVYGVKDVEFYDKLKDEYCHKTVYYFAFWLLNINFILIALVAVLCLGVLLFVIVSPKEEAIV